jgi:hypothetical protein
MEQNKSNLNRLEGHEVLQPLLDGLDEASSGPGRRRMARLFTLAAQSFRCRIVVTTLASPPRPLITARGKHLPSQGSLSTEQYGIVAAPICF